MKPIRLVLMLGLCLIFGERSFAALMVVRAVGPSAASYPAGAILDSNGTISLKKGDRLTLLDGSGTRLVTGPMAGKLTTSARTGSNARGTIDELHKIFNRAREGRSVLGASRGFSMPPDFPQPLPPSLWVINVQKGGNWCVPANLRAFVTSQETRLPMTLEMRASGQDRRVDWPKGLKELPLPAMGQDRAAFTLFANGKSVGEFAVRVIPASDGDIVGLAQHFLGNECYSQIDLIQAVTD